MLNRVFANSSNSLLRALARSGSRFVHSSAPALLYKKWGDISLKDKQAFINNYVGLYKEKHPCSKSNVMYQTLVGEMEEYDDAPYVFGILYNEIRSVSQNESADNAKGSGAMGDPDFEKLLYR
ncbi:KLTH0H11792p [Lachancea thermotolerans CBS 6340]|uniref:KLTH0H11792p n=1 Tax=Lachancea thermotolerans (strain ATCC 56472 / CBS 6340 / NRRL Y-8284) TaxID=559295 RepID=C5E3A9_LACTC|nr:KLTH0H11792p [Lachancea thermotolerans CBS 6340]CAR30520.1 KLTH0H11792p [Lachancea thermotolerans CBS 6340]